jgi:hypothetical protein
MRLTRGTDTERGTRTHAHTPSLPGVTTMWWNQAGGRRWWPHAHAGHCRQQQSHKLHMRRRRHVGCPHSSQLPHPCLEVTQKAARRHRHQHARSTRPRQRHHTQAVGSNPARLVSRRTASHTLAAQAHGQVTGSAEPSHDSTARAKQARAASDRREGGESCDMHGWCVKCMAHEMMGMNTPPSNPYSRQIDSAGRGLWQAHAHTNPLPPHVWSRPRWWSPSQPTHVHARDWRTASLYWSCVLQRRGSAGAAPTRAAGNHE